MKTREVITIEGGVYGYHGCSVSHRSNAQLTYLQFYDCTRPEGERIKNCFYILEPAAVRGFRQAFEQAEDELVKAGLLSTG